MQNYSFIMQELTEWLLLSKLNIYKIVNTTRNDYYLKNYLT